MLFLCTPQSAASLSRVQRHALYHAGMIVSFCLAPAIAHAYAAETEQLTSKTPENLQSSTMPLTLKEKMVNFGKVVVAITKRLSDRSAYAHLTALPGCIKPAISNIETRSIAEIEEIQARFSKEQAMYSYISEHKLASALLFAECCLIAKSTINGISYLRQPKPNDQPPQTTASSVPEIVEQPQEAKKDKTPVLGHRATNLAGNARLTTPPPAVQVVASPSPARPQVIPQPVTAPSPIVIPESPFSQSSTEDETDIDGSIWNPPPAVEEDVAPKMPEAAPVDPEYQRPISKWTNLIEKLKRHEAAKKLQTFFRLKRKPKPEILTLALIPGKTVQNCTPQPLDHELRRSYKIKEKNLQPSPIVLVDLPQTPEPVESTATAAAGGSLATTTKIAAPTEKPKKSVYSDDDLAPKFFCFDDIASGSCWITTSSTDKELEIMQIKDGRCVPWPNTDAVGLLSINQEKLVSLLHITGNAQNALKGILERQMKKNKDKIAAEEAARLAATSKKRFWGLW